METNDFDILFKKNFSDLSEQEISEMKELFTNEEEFNQMKMMLFSIEQTVENEKIEPTAKLKENLDHLFYQKYQSKGVLWYNAIPKFFISRDKSWHQQNLIRIAAVALLLFSIYPFLNTKLEDKSVQLSKNETPKTKELEKDKIPNLVKENDEVRDSDISQNSNNITSKQNEGLRTAKRSVANEEPIFTSFAESVPSEMSVDESSAGFSHPDGIFSSSAKDIGAESSLFTLKNHLDVLELLTATY